MVSLVVLREVGDCMNEHEAVQPGDVDQPTRVDAQIVREADVGATEKKRCISCGADLRDDGSLPCGH